MAEEVKGIISIEINTGQGSQQLKQLQSQINAFNLSLNKGNTVQGAFAKEYSKELQTAINKTGFFTAETVKLSTAASTLDKVMSKGKVSLGQFFSARFNKDSAIAAETMALAAERARRMQTQFIATSAAAGGMQEALAIRPLSAFSSQATIAAQKSQILSQMFKQGTTQLINFGKNVQWAGRQLMVGFTVPLTIFGAMAGKTFREIEKEAVNFKKVYGDIFTTDQEIEDQLKNVKELSKEFTKYGIAVKDTMQLAAIGAQAGKTGAELQEATIQATRLAVLGDLDRQEAMRTTIALQSAFKLSNEELGNSINFLNMVENSSVLSLQDLSEAIPRVAPVIVGLGGTVKEMAVFLTAMREGGVNAAEAANGLKSSLGRLITPTRQATEMANGFGISLDGIVQANEGNVLGMVISLSQAMKQLTDLQKQQLLSAVFGKFQFARMGALFENITREGSQASRVIEMMGMSIEDMASTAEKELSAIEESAGTQIVAAIERLKLAIAPIGEIFVKIAIPIVNFLTKIIEKFENLSEGQKQFAAIAAVIVGVVIPAGTMFLGLLMNLVGTLLKMGQGLGAFTKGLITGGPLGAIKALTQSSKYLSLAEIDAAMAAQQLALSSDAVNAALLKQAASAGTATVALDRLLATYYAMIKTQGAVSSFPSFAVAASAARGIKTGGAGFNVQKRNSGGPIFMSDGTTVPGAGNTDTVPAMLTPGEFVVNKKATSQNLDLLHAINNSKKFNKGGIAKGVQYFNEDEQIRVVRQARYVEGGFDELERETQSQSTTNNTSQERRRVGQFDQRVQPMTTRYSSEIPTSLLRRFPGSGPIKPIDFDPKASSFLHMQRNVVNAEGSAKLSGARYMSMALDVSNLTPTQQAHAFVDNLTGYRGARMVGNIGFKASSYLNAGVHPIQDLIDDLNYRILYRENPYEGTMKAAGLSGARLESAKNKVHRQVIGKLRAMQYAGQVTFDAGDSKQMSGVYKVMEKAVEKSLRISGVGAQGIQDLYFGGEKNVSHFKFRPGISGDAIRNLPPSPNYSFVLPDTPEGIRLGLTGRQVILRRPGFEDIKMRTGGSNQHNKINSQLLKRAAAALATRGRSLRMKSGGQVPGMQYFAVNNRQRVVQEAKNLAERWTKNSDHQRMSTSSMDIRSNLKEMDTLKTLATRTTEDQVAMRKLSMTGLEFPKSTHRTLSRISSRRASQEEFLSLFGKEKFGIYNDFGSYTKNDLNYLLGKTFTNKTSLEGTGYLSALRQREAALDKIKDVKRFISSRLSEGMPRELVVQAVEKHPRYKDDLIRLKRMAKSRGKEDFSIQDYIKFYEDSAELSLKMARGYIRHGSSPRDAYLSRSVPKGSKVIDFSKMPDSKYPDEQELVLGPQKVDLESISSVLGGNYFKGHPDTRKNRLELLKNRELTMPLLIKTKTDNPIELNTLRFNKGGMLKGYNKGNIVPGVGNTDTVPAMLTPGEFVINKEATQKNLDLLKNINNGTVSGYNKGGKIPGVQRLNIGGIAMAAGLAGSYIPSMIFPEMGIAGHMVSGTLGWVAASKVATLAMKKFGKQTLNAVDSAGDVAKNMSKTSSVVKNIASVGTRIVTVGGGIPAAFLALGFGAYKLNKNLEEMQDASGDLIKAMYGSADRTRAAAEAFGTESYADIARRRAVEKIGRQEISAEAQEESKKILETDFGKQLLLDIESAKSAGKNAAEALRNQLSSFIVAGVITTEQARAIALEIGNKLNDQSMSVKVSGELTRLFGADGKDILKNLSTITAEISPKVNFSTFEKDAKREYEGMNALQKFGQMFKGGEAGYTRGAIVDKTSEANATALENEAQARQLLNLALSEGAINLEEYQKQESVIAQNSKKNTKIIEDANARAFGTTTEEYKKATEKIKPDVDIVKKYESMTGEELNNLYLSEDFEKQKSEYDNAKKAIEEYTDKYKDLSDQISEINKQNKESVQTMFTDMGMNENAAKGFIKEIEGSLAKIDPNVWSAIQSGKLSFQNIEPMIKISRTGDFTQEQMETMYGQIETLRSIPNIEKVVNIDAIGAENLNSLYNEYNDFTKLSNIEKQAKFETADAQQVLDKLGVSYNDLSNLSDIQKTVFIRYIDQYMSLGKSKTSAAETAGGDIENIRLVGQYGMTQDAILNDMKEQIKVANDIAAQLGLDDGGGGGSSTDWKKYLENRFDLVQQRLSMEEQAYEDLIRIKQRENQIDQRTIDLNQRALDSISKKEKDINDAYSQRIDVLDGVSKANNRLRDQEQSRISLASALASGNIGAAASQMADITNQNAAYQIEDARSALEKQKEEDLKNIKVEVNGVLLTRQEIEANIDAIEEKIYQRNLLIQDQQDKLYAIEQERLKNTREREKVETRLYILEQQKAITELRRKSVYNRLSSQEIKDLENYKLALNQTISTFNSAYGENMPQVRMYGGKINKLANGGMVNVGSTEPPPSLKMNFGNIVPGIGNTDRVPALLTPGEFVVRKSAAQQNMSLLKAINGDIFPSVSGPKFKAPSSEVSVSNSPSISSSTMYNDTYNINVNVAGSNSSPDEIANIVLNKISGASNANIRSRRYNG